MSKFLVLVIASLAIGCNKAVEPNAPVTFINTENVYNSDATAISVLTGLYAQMSNTAGLGAGGLLSISIIGGLSSDELKLFDGSSDIFQKAYYQNSLQSMLQGYSYWNIMYPQIYTCNSAIEGLQKSNSLTPAVKRQLLGEAKFTRAFLYFYLTNLYGDVPLALTTDYEINAKLPRTAKSEVVNQIIDDLKEAQSNLSDTYLDATLLRTSTERVRPTRWAASALLARSYLFNEAWNLAEVTSTAILSNTTLFDTVALNNVFLKNSKEAIWQLQPVINGWNTEDARTFLLTTSPVGVNANHPVFLQASLVNGFEVGDNRKISWVGSFTDVSGTYYFPNKYKSATQSAAVTEYAMVFRLSEQYLIRAEARVQQNNLTGGLSDINVIRKRAGLASFSSSDKTAILSLLARERQSELFTEWAHRWLDLKRTNTVNSVMTLITPTKGGVWTPSDQLYPIPLADVERNRNIVQNPGY